MSIHFGERRMSAEAALAAHLVGSAVGVGLILGLSMLATTVALLLF